MPKLPRDVSPENRRLGYMGSGRISAEMLRGGMAEMTRPEAITLPLALFVWRANVPRELASESTPRP